MAVVLLAAMLPRSAGAQAGIPDDYRDSLVLRLAAVRSPCPDPPPAEWSLVDSTLGRSPRCSLVEAAARLIRDRLSAGRMPRDGVPDPWRPLCVRLVEMENTGSTGLPGDWMVVFDLTPTLSADVVLDRRSGAPAMVMMGDGTRRWGPPCVTRSRPQ
jgi:hypothetical protein